MPDELAMLFASSLLASGKFEDFGAAVSQAWWIVPEYYRSRGEWATLIFPTFWPSAFPMSPNEGEDATAAYVGQGEDRAFV